MANWLCGWAVAQAHAFRHTCLDGFLGDVPSSSPQQRPSCRRGICDHHSGISAPLLRSHIAAALQGAGRAISCLAYRLRLSGNSQGYASKRRRSGVHRYLVEVVTGPFQSLRQLGEVYSLATNFVGSCGFPTPAAVTCATPSNHSMLDSASPEPRVWPMNSPHAPMKANAIRKGKARTNCGRSLFFDRRFRMTLTRRSGATANVRLT